MFAISEVKTLAHGGSFVDDSLTKKTGYCN